MLLLVLVMLMLAAVLGACTSSQVTETAAESDPMEKLDAPLRMAMDGRAEHDSLDIFLELTTGATDGSIGQLESLGLVVATQSESIVAGRASVASIRRLAADPGVRSISLSQERRLN
jgi:hypothetical protein